MTKDELIYLPTANQRAIDAGRRPDTRQVLPCDGSDPLNHRHIDGLNTDGRALRGETSVEVLLKKCVFDL
jgi:hypothetical protein